MKDGGSIAYFFDVERMVVEQQIRAALKRTAALRTAAATQNDFSGAARARQLEQILLQSQRKLNKL